MEMSYEQWHTQTAAVLLDSHLPKAFVEEYISNRPVMYKLYDEGFTAAEVSAHVSKQYGALRSKRNRESLARVVLVLLMTAVVPAACFFTYHAVYQLTGYFESVADFLMFALIPCGMCVLPLVIMAVFWMKSR